MSRSRCTAPAFACVGPAASTLVGPCHHSQVSTSRSHCSCRFQGLCLCCCDDSRGSCCAPGLEVTLAVVDHRSASVHGRNDLELTRRVPMNLLSTHSCSLSSVVQGLRSLGLVARLGLGCMRWGPWSDGWSWKRGMVRGNTSPQKKKCTRILMMQPLMPVPRQKPCETNAPICKILCGNESTGVRNCPRTDRLA
jgi:hypothetical protein